MNTNLFLKIMAASALANAISQAEIANTVTAKPEPKKKWVIQARSRYEAICYARLNKVTHGWEFQLRDCNAKLVQI